MQSDRELLKQALHTLEGWANHGEWVWPESALEQAKRNTTEAITALRERLAQPEFDSALQSAAMTQTVPKLAQPEQKRPQNCGTSYCSCIECVMEPEQPEQSPLDRMAENARELGLDYEPTGIAVRKVWWDGDTLRAEAIPPEQFYKQPEQEPVAWVWKDGTLTSDPDRADGTWTPLYTTPPRREWVGLTQEEIDECYQKYGQSVGYIYERAIEAKLREKNT